MIAILRVCTGMTPLFPVKHTEVAASLVLEIKDLKKVFVALTVQILL